MTSLSESTLRRHIDHGDLPSSKVGRRRVIARADLENFMQRRRSASGGGRTPARARERPATGHLPSGGGSRRPVRSDPDRVED